MKEILRILIDDPTIKLTDVSILKTVPICYYMFLISNWLMYQYWRLFQQATICSYYKTDWYTILYQSWRLNQYATFNGDSRYLWNIQFREVVYIVNLNIIYCVNLIMNFAKVQILCYLFFKVLLAFNKSANGKFLNGNDISATEQ